MTQHGSEKEGARALAPEKRPEPATVVERVTHQDVPEICSLYKRVWDTPGAAGVPAELVKSWQPSPLEFTSWMEGVTYFAARRNGRLVGVVGCEVSHGSCELVHLAVDPEVRRQGVGAALVGAGVEWARHSSAAQVWAYALSRFTGAGALLLHLGFTECGVLHRHDWNEDVRIFERIL